MEEDQPNSTATAAADVANGTYLHEKIKKMDIAIFDDEQEEYDYDFMHMVDDPEKTEVEITIVINRYVQSSSAAPETLDDTTERSFNLKGFLKDDTPDELDDLLIGGGDKAVTARTVEKIKKYILRRRDKIRKVASRLRLEKIVVSMKLDIFTWRSDNQDDADADDDYEEDDDEEEMVLGTDDDDDNVSWKPALRSSVVLETRIFENKQDFEMNMMLKIRGGCGG